MNRTVPTLLLASLLSPGLLAATPPPLRIEVVNRSGIPGLGHKAARFLRDAGYTVSAFDDTLRYDREVTFLYYAEGCGPRTVSLARAIPGEQEVVQAPYPLQGADVRLIIGADLGKRLP